MIKKLLYSKPEMSIVEVEDLQPLLTYSGAANSPELDTDSDFDFESVLNPNFD
jgi:hypothetical protein